MPKAKITALGCYTPPGLLTNQDLEKLVDTNDQWILERTGIRERHIAAKDMATSDMAIEAAKCALAQRGVDRHGGERHHRLHGHPGLHVSRPPPAWCRTASARAAPGAST